MIEPSQIGQKISELWVVYQPMLPDFVLAFVLAILLTPIMSKLAARIGAMDLPAHLRRRTDNGLDRNINARVHPRLGGLAMAIAMLVALLALGHLGNVSWGIIVGIIVVIAYGLLDDVKDLAFKYQLLGQVLAATAVVISGITVMNIQVAGIFIDFHAYSQTFAFGNLLYNFVFPADLLTIIWIVGMINFVNWMSGMDGLNHFVTAIASAMILLIAVDQGNIFVAMLISAHLGANLGAAVFNYPPAYIFPGAIGEHLNGFLLAVFAILSGGKLPLAVIALAIPIVDAVWVMFTRVRKSLIEEKSIKKALLAMTQADTNHLHHRLMALGFSWKSVLAIEVGITIALTAVGFSLSGFRNDFVALVASLSILIILIAVIYSYSRYQEKRKILQKAMDPFTPEESKVEVIYKQPKGSDEKFVY